MSGSPYVLCFRCRQGVRRRQSWQEFTMLRSLGASGGGRIVTKAGAGEDEYHCNACARVLDLAARGQVVGDPLFGDQ